MVRSFEIIRYLSENIDRKNYISFFTAGSLPEELTPKSDLDLFFVINENKKDTFFNRLSNLMKKYIKINHKIIYTFFRGPIKYKTKGLVHFLVYTLNDTYNPDNKELFINEHKTVLKSLAETSELIQGESVRNLIKDVDLNDPIKINVGISRSKEKYELLKSEGYINFPEWKNTKNGWKLLRTKKHAGIFLKEYLLKYFEKRI